MSKLLPKIGLCCIVKDESKVIERALKSVLPIIDYAVIVDTGSTDGTQEIIKKFLSKHQVPHDLIEEDLEKLRLQQNFRPKASKKEKRRKVRNHPRRG